MPVRKDIHSPAAEWIRVNRSYYYYETWETEQQRKAYIKKNK